MTLFRSLSLILACAIGASGQAVVESAVGTAAATGASSGASGAGKAVGGVFGSLTKVLENTAASTAAPSPSPSAASIQTPSPAAALAKAPPSRPIDPTVVVAGLTRAQLIELCGSPTLATQRTRAGSVLETFWYQTTTDDDLEVYMTDGKVTSSILASEKLRTPRAAAK